MDRTTPSPGNEEIDLYLRTYYSLLRSTVPIRLRSLEETHAAMNSNLHVHAGGLKVDVAALSYSALRLPLEIPAVKLVVMGQMEEVFWREGYPDVARWELGKARARRRKYYLSPRGETLAAFIASVSDIDDLIPILVAYQIEWNKLHHRLTHTDIGRHLRALGDGDTVGEGVAAQIRQILEIGIDDFDKLNQIWPGAQFTANLRHVVEHELDINVQVLGSGLTDYRKAVQFWWSKVLLAGTEYGLDERPIYFISSNAHSVANVLSGYPLVFRDELAAYLRRENPENLAEEHERLSARSSPQLLNLYSYSARLYLDHEPNAKSTCIEHEESAGILRVSDPHCLDVEAQVGDFRRLRREWLDPRLGPFDDESWALLQASDALIFNIDYPLGMSAYHIFSQVSSAIGTLLGVYVLGKAASLNGRVGDVMVPNVVYDEHSKNTYLFRNCFTAGDLDPYLNFGAVFDNQKAVTVRGTFLQNSEFMHVFYEEGYTDIEMEAGPYLSGIYEDIYPKRYPTNEIVNLFINAPYDIGLVHYASDTPISRRQTLLSKSLSYFGVDATYATTIAALQRVFQQEIERQRGL